MRDSGMSYIPPLVEGASLSYADLPIMNSISTVTESPKQQEERARRKRELVKKIVQGVTSVASLFWLLALSVATSAVTIFAVLCGLMVSMLVAFQQKKLTEQEDIRSIQNEMRHTVNDLQMENMKLQHRNDRLERECGKLNNIQEEMQEKFEKQGVTLDSFVEQIKENKTIMKEMREHLKSEVTQEIFRVVMASDRDKNFILGRNEREILTVRLHMINGVDFDEDLFRQTFPSNISMKDIYSLLKGLADDNVNEGVGRIFKFEPTHMMNY